jgi:hypothetical protein
MDKLKLRENAKNEKAKSLKENAIRQATVWSADSNEGFTDFMNDEDLTKEKIVLKPHKGEVSNLIYQVAFSLKLSQKLFEIFNYYILKKVQC